MKKYLILAALCSVLASCQWYYENVASVDDCLNWHCDNVYEAAKEGDFEDFREAYIDLMEWYTSLDDSDRFKAESAMRNWKKSNKFKDKVIENYFEEHAHKLPQY